MPVKYEINGQLYEFEREPTEQDIDEVAEAAKAGDTKSETSSTGQPQSIFTTADIKQDSPIREKSPLNPLQHIILSLAPNDNAKMRYLADKFSGAQIDQDETGNIRIDGRRINPEGFQVAADLLGNVGIALPIGGQIVGGLAGGATGSGLPGAGTVAGAIGGGVAGAAIGETARVGLGAMAGIPQDFSEASGSVAKEAAFGLGGELATRGAIAGTKAVVKATGADVALAKFWRETMHKLGKYAPEIAHYVGDIDKDAVRVAQRHGFNATLSKEYFAEDKMNRVVKKTLLGYEDADMLKASQTSPELQGLQAGAIDIARNIKAVDDMAYTELVKRVTGLSDETVNTIKSASIAEIASKQNLARDRAFGLANEFEAMAKAKKEILGKALGRAEDDALRASKHKSMAVDDLGKELGNILKEIKGNIRVPGFKNVKQHRIPGLSELEGMKNALGGLVVLDEATGKKAFKFYGEELTTRGGKVLKVLERPSLRQLNRRLKAIDKIADSLMENTHVSKSVRLEAGDWLRKLRGRYDEILGLTEKNSVYSEFAQVVNGAKIDRGSFLANFEGQVRNFRKITGSQMNAFNAVLNNLEPGASSKLVRNIDLLNAGDELKKVGVTEAVTKLQTMFNSKNLIKAGENSADDLFVTQVGDLMKKSGSVRARGLAYMDEVEKTLAAKEFIKGSPNLLRVQSVLRLSGLGMLGYMSGGPIGAAGAIALSSPGNMARILAKLERGVTLPRPIKQGLQAAGRVAPAAGSLLLEKLLRSQGQQSTSQTQE